MKRTAYVVKVLLATALLMAVLAAVAQNSKEGGHLVIAMNGDSEPASLDGQVDPYQSTWLIDTLVSDHVVGVDPKTGDYTPFLASSWDESDGGRTWTFHLRQGVKFQDGTPFNAEALKYNFARILNPDTGSAQAADNLGPISSMDVVDDHTLVLHYDQPWISLLDGLRRIPIWSPKALKQYSSGQFDHHLVGTGPFKLEEWVPKDHVTFVRWGEYNWGPPFMDHKGAAYLQSVTFKFVSEQLVRGTIIKTPNADAVWDLPSQYANDYSNNPNYKLLKGFQSGTGLQYVMNTTKAPLDNINVRKAIRYAVNQKGLNNLVYEGLYLPTYGPLNSVSPCYDPAVEHDYAYDPAKAKSLLADAGWVEPSGGGTRVAKGVDGVPDGTKLQVLWVALSRQSLGEALQAQLKQVGIDLQLKIVPGPVQLQMAQDKSFGLMYERQRTPSPSVLYELWYSGNDKPGGWAWTGYKGAQLDDAVSSIQSAANEQEACKYAKQAQEIVNSKALQLPTLSQAMFYVLKDKVKGFQLGHEGNWFYVYNTYLAQ